MNRNRCRRFSLISILALAAACADVGPQPDDTPGSGEESLAVSEVDAATNRVLVGQFTGRYDAETGELSLDVVPAPEWTHAFPQTDDETRTVEQALWCPQRRHEQQRLFTVTGSIGSTLEDCGIPSNSITLGLGAFCADVELQALVDLVHPVAELTQVTSGYEGYSYLESSGLIGVDPLTLGGPNPPSTLLGLFGWADTLTGGFSRTTWAFHNAGGSFGFRGDVWAEMTETCDGVDNDCDTEIDEGAGCMFLGEGCIDHVDCESGNCGTGVCAASTCGNLVEDGSETGTDCGGTCAGCGDGLGCLVGGDCLSDSCYLGVCVPNRYPNPGEVIVSEFQADGLAVGGLGTDQEWFELYNLTDEDLRLDGCQLNDSANTHDIGDPLVIPARGFVVMADEATGSIAAPDYVWSGFGLNNSGDTIGISCLLDGVDLTLIDTIDYLEEQVVDQFSSQLHSSQLTAAGNNVTANFCFGSFEYATGYFGTPGAANVSCDITIDACAYTGPALVLAPALGTALLTGTVEAVGVSDGSGVDEISGRFGGEIGYGPSGIPPAISGEWTWSSGVPSEVWDSGVDLARPYDFELAIPPEEGDFDLGVRFTGNNGGTYTYCDGDGVLSVVPAAAPPAAVGDLLITEFMADPDNQTGADAQSGEWFEVYNTTAEPLELQGCAVTGLTDSFTIDTTVIVPAYSYSVFANNGDETENHGVVVDYVWSGFALGNSGDSISVDCDLGAGLTPIDAISYESSDESNAVALQLDPNHYDATANDTIAVFCDSATPYGDDGNLGTPGAVNPICFSIGWCRLQFPTDYTNTGLGAAVTTYARLYVADITDLSTSNNPQGLIVGDVGYGPDGTIDPDGDLDWTWFPATPNSGYGGDEIDNDEYQADLIAPIADGPYDVAFRFSANGGATYTYCDLDGGLGADGSEDGYFAGNAGDLTLAPVRDLDWCGLVSGESVNDVTGDVFTYHGQLYIEDVTSLAGSELDPNVMAQFGHGPDGVDPNLSPGDWTWDVAPFDQQIGDNDQFAYDFTVPALVDGPLDTGFRFSGNGGLDWSYCDAGAGLDDGWDTPGDLVVDPWTIGFCELQDITLFSGAPGATQDYYGRVWAFHDADGSGGWTDSSEDGTARTIGGVHDNLANVLMDMGYGADGVDPSDASWVWTTAIAVDQGVDISSNDDEFGMTLTLPADGDYDTAFRASGDNGATYSYCGDGDTHPSGPVGELTSVTPSDGLPDGTVLYSESFDGQDGQGADGDGEDTSLVTWSLDTSAASLTASSDFCLVSGDEFVVQDSDGDCVWSSPSFDISAAAAVTIDIAFAETGDHEGTDCIAVTYVIDTVATTVTNYDGLGDTSCSYVGDLSLDAFGDPEVDDGDFVSSAFSVAGLTGTTMSISVLFENNAGTEQLYMDDVTVTVLAPPTGGEPLPYTEDFDGDDGQGVVGSTTDPTEDFSLVSWLVDYSEASLSATTDWCVVDTDQFDVRDADGPCVWQSPTLDVSAVSTLTWGATLTAEGGLESDDYANLAISLDGGAFVSIPDWDSMGDATYTLVDDWNAGLATIVSTDTDVSAASTAVIQIGMSNGASAERIYLDDVTASGI